MRTLLLILCLTAAGCGHTRINLVQRTTVVGPYLKVETALSVQPVVVDH